MNRTDGTWNYKAVTWGEIRLGEVWIRHLNGRWFVPKTLTGSHFVQPYIRTKEAVPLEFWEALHPDNRDRVGLSTDGGKTWSKPRWDGCVIGYDEWLFRLPPIGTTKSVTATDEQWEQIKVLGVEVSE